MYKDIDSEREGISLIGFFIVPFGALHFLNFVLYVLSSNHELERRQNHQDTQEQAVQFAENRRSQKDSREHQV